MRLIFLTHLAGFLFYALTLHLVVAARDRRETDTLASVMRHLPLRELSRIEIEPSNAGG